MELWIQLLWHMLRMETRESGWMSFAHIEKGQIRRRKCFRLHLGACQTTGRPYNRPSHGRGLSKLGHVGDGQGLPPDERLCRWPRVRRSYPGDPDMCRIRANNSETIRRSMWAHKYNYPQEAEFRPPSPGSSALEISTPCRHATLENTGGVVSQGPPRPMVAPSFGCLPPVSCGP